MPTKTLTRKHRSRRASAKHISREDRLEALSAPALRRRLDASLSRLTGVIKRPR